MNSVEPSERLQQLAEEYRTRAEAIRRDLASQRDPISPSRLRSGRTMMCCGGCCWKPRWDCGK